jgi:parallel beta-helix repeat protein
MVRKRHWVLAAIVSIALLGSLILPLQGPFEHASAYTPWGEINIEGDGAFNVTNGVTGGNGTEADPYLIEGWQIVVATADGIRIAGTTAHFVVRGVAVYGSMLFWAVVLEDAPNGSIESSVFSDSDYCINILRSPGTVVWNCTFSVHQNAIFVTESDGVEISECVASSVNFFAEIQSSDGCTVSDNVVIGGSRIPGPAIYIGASDSVVVSRNVISGKDYGVTCSSSANCTISNNTVESCGNAYFDYYGVGTSLSGNYAGNSTENGVWLWGSENTGLVDNCVSFSSRYGVRMISARNCSFEGNVFARDGIVMEGSSLEHFASHAISADNVLKEWINGTGPEYPILYFHDGADVSLDGAHAGQVLIANCSGVSLANLSFNRTDVAVQMWDVSNVALSSLTIEECLDGINVRTCVNLTLRDSTMTWLYAWDNGDGIDIEYGENVTIVDNEFSGLHYDAIRLGGTSNARVSNNTMISCGTGVEISGANTDIVVSQNDIAYSSYHGLLLMQSSNSTIIGNTVSNCGYAGIWVRWCDQANVVGNNLTDNEYGVIMDDCANCFVYFNNFMGSDTQNAWQINGGSVGWDGGYPHGGNYWIDSSHVDLYSGPAQDILGPDGIDDSPMWIPDYTYDGYPLMSPYWTSDFLPIPRLWSSASEGDVTTVFTFDASGSWDFEDPSESLEVRWDWDGDGTWDTDWSTTKVVDHQFAQAGEYNITVIVRDSLGQTDALSMGVTVSGVIPEFQGLWLPVLVVMACIVFARRGVKG